MTKAFINIGADHGLTEVNNKFKKEVFDWFDRFLKKEETAVRGFFAVMREHRVRYDHGLITAHELGRLQKEYERDLKKRLRRANASISYAYDWLSTIWKEGKFSGGLGSFLRKNWEETSVRFLDIMLRIDQCSRRK